MSQTAVQLLIAAVGGSALTGFATALLRWQPERTNILLTAAQGAVVVQSGVIDDLHDELLVLRKRVKVCEEQVEEVDQLRRQVERFSADLQRVTFERDRLRRENDTLKGRVATLEAEVAELKRANGAEGAT